MAVRPYRLLGDELSLAASTIEGRDQRKGGKVVTIPLAPRTGRAIGLAVGERCDGPLFLAPDGRRLDRHSASLDWHATYIVAAYLAGASR
jgi:hypothetical protein